MATAKVVFFVTMATKTNKNHYFGIFGCHGNKDFPQKCIKNHQIFCFHHFQHEKNIQSHFWPKTVILFDIFDDFDLKYCFKYSKTFIKYLLSCHCYIFKGKEYRHRHLGLPKDQVPKIKLKKIILNFYEIFTEILCLKNSLKYVKNVLHVRQSP